MLVDLGNCVYGRMVHALAQLSAPAPLPVMMRQGLADGSAELMRLMTTIGEACARTPAGASHLGVNAGMTFALPRSFGQLVHASAAPILAERAIELAAPARRMKHVIPDVGDRLERLAHDFRTLHETCASRFQVAVTDRPDPAAKPGGEAPASFCALDSGNEASTDKLTVFFDPKRCIHSRMCVLNAPDVFLANVKGPWLHPENDGVEHLVHVAMSCPSGAITYRRRDGGEEEPPPKVNYLFIREHGPYAVQASLNIEGQSATYRATLCRCGQSRNKPFCDNSHHDAGFAATGEPPSIKSAPLADRGGRLHVKPLVDGPLAISGPLEICCGTGRTVARTESARLCRCGASRNKPFCDGSHRAVGFRSKPD